MKKMKAHIPMLEWLPKYPVRHLRFDVLAGLTVAVMLIPQGMAYSMLAGLPPVYGLYGGLVPLLLYSLMGTSKQLSIGPTALVSLLVLAGLSPLAEPGTEAFIRLAILVSLLAGIIQFFLGIFRLGFLINFLAQPVLMGFTSAAAIIIGLSQFKYLMGFPSGGRTSSAIMMMNDILDHALQTHWITLLLGGGSMVFLFLQRKWLPGFPGALGVVIIGVLLVKWIGLKSQGVELVGAIPRGIPEFTIPVFSWTEFSLVIPPAITICLISFIESLAIGQVLQKRTKSAKIVPDQELIALGVSKIGGAFFQALPTTGSFTRSAVNQQAGSRSGLSSIAAALFLALTLLFLTPFFEDLPLTVLAAIIIVSVVGLIEWRSALQLWRTDRTDFWILVATFLSTLLLGIQLGVIMGVTLSVALMVYRNARPHVAILGQIPDTRHFRNLERFEWARQEKDILVLRFDAQLYFGNGAYFEAFIQSEVDKRLPELKLLILDASNIHHLDSTGIESLKDVLDWLAEKSVSFSISNAIGPIRDALYRHGLLERVGTERIFLSTADAVDAFRDQESTQVRVSQIALKTSLEELNQK